MGQQAVRAGVDSLKLPLGLTEPLAPKFDGPCGPKGLRFDRPNGQSIKRKALLWAG